MFLFLFFQLNIFYIYIFYFKTLTTCNLKNLTEKVDFTI